MGVSMILPSSITDATRAPSSMDRHIVHTGVAEDELVRIGLRNSTRLAANDHAQFALEDHFAVVVRRHANALPGRQIRAGCLE